MIFFEKFHLTGKLLPRTADGRLVPLPLSCSGESSTPTTESRPHRHILKSGKSLRGAAGRAHQARLDRGHIVNLAGRVITFQYCRRFRGSTSCGKPVHPSRGLELRFSSGRVGPLAGQIESSTHAKWRGLSRASKRKRRRKSPKHG